MFSNLYNRLVQWPDRRRYCPLQDPFRLSSQAQIASRSIRSVSRGNRTAQARDNDFTVDGHSFLSLLKHLSDLTRQKDEIAGQIHTQDRERYLARSDYDLCQMDLDKLRDSDSVEVLHYLDRRKQLQKDELANKSAADDAKELLVSRCGELKEGIQKLWRTIHARSQAYSDACFRANFDREWCMLDLVAYLDMFRCAQIQSFLTQNRRELNRQRVNRILLRSQTRIAIGAHASTSDILPSPVRQDLRRIRDQRHEEAIEEVESHIRVLEDIVGLQEAHLAERRDNLIRERFRPELEQKGLLKSDSDATGPQHDRVPLEQLAPALTGHPVTENSHHGSDLPDHIDELLEEHDTLLKKLENLQEEVARCAVDVRSSVPEYFIAFTDLTTEKLEAYIAHDSKTANDAAAKIEQRLILIRKHLHDRGVPVPVVTASTVHQQPTGGGLSTTSVENVSQNDKEYNGGSEHDSHESRKLNRRIMNDHRLNASQAQGRSPNSAATPSSDVDLTGVRSSLGADRPQQSPQSEQSARRKRMLREYKAAQGRSDDDVNDGRKRQRTKTAIKDQAQESIVEAETIMSTGRVTRASTKRDNTRLLGGIR
ncbi:uncharacterized protein RHO25_012964 [Cercospora beticola]|uniref:Uncharacterized protein n=1 Tax=Cercospora beticola TaxID=122368 RepID=A0ABZ0P900_CERBT|nr:hypothetical protein RHO25_012964 [Cercospora beticola]CAK1367820.1 unnamed protein product [Cercospora beticola]